MPDTIDRLVRQRAEQHGDKPMVIDPAARITYGELDDTTRALAAAFLEAQQLGTEFARQRFRVVRGESLGAIDGGTLRGQLLQGWADRVKRGQAAGERLEHHKPERVLVRR